MGNKGYANASATALSRHTPLIWTEMKYCIGADINSIISGSLSFFSTGRTKAIFSLTWKIPDLKEQSTSSQ